MKRMMIKQEYLSFIKEGRKKLAIRVGYKNIRNYGQQKIIFRQSG
jgi:ASC-1-like (ASCH) protein